ncbi:MAG TPA: hypothetical protein VIV12_18435 [Streptosporangiaceae bacterium]
MCDLVRFERRGIPAVGIATSPFADEAIQQARLLGMPDCRAVYVPHPVQLLTLDELAALADAVFPALLSALTQPEPGPARAPTEPAAPPRERGDR